AGAGRGGRGCWGGGGGLVGPPHVNSRYACRSGRSLPPVGMFGALRLLTIVMSKRTSLPRPHWPPTSGVLVTFGTGPLAQLIGPTSVLRLVALMAATMAPLSSTLADRFSASSPTSNRA